MAYIMEDLDEWVVCHGLTGRVLSRHPTRDAAADRVGELHGIHQPHPENRGEAARDRHARCPTCGRLRDAAEVEGG